MLNVGVLPCDEIVDLSCISIGMEDAFVNSSEFVPASTFVNSDVTVEECVFYPPVSGGGRVVEIYKSCINGTCNCVNLIGGIHCDLRPCRVGYFLFSGSCVLPSFTVGKVWDGLCDGFEIVDENCTSKYDCENYLSISKGRFKNEMSDLLKSELLEGKVSFCESKPRCIHSLGAVTKSDGRLRPITDCSMPEEDCINNFMNTTCKDFTYNSVNDVARDLDEGDFMCVVDIASAYRSVPIYPPHLDFQGFTWDFEDGEGEKFLRENRLCFGLKCAPYIFSLMSDVVVAMAKSKGLTRLVNYLDDFIITEPSYEQCLASQSMLLSIIRQLGFSVSWKKVSPPATRTTFLGITIDSLEMNLSIPPIKIDKLVEMISDLEHAMRATRKQLERLGGLVSHFSSVIRGGRTFCRRIYDLFGKCPKKGSICLEEEILSDLSWWKNLCSIFNGSAKIIGKDLGGMFTTDASTWGFGGWSEGDWFLGCWEGNSTCPIKFHDHMVDPPSDSDFFSKNINVYELYAILVSLRRWGHALRDTQIQVVTDNNQALFMINTGRSANKCCMAWLREIYWLCFIFNVELFAVYIKSKDNVFADTLSRADKNDKLDLILNTIIDLNLCCHHVAQVHPHQLSN